MITGSGASPTGRPGDAPSEAEIRHWLIHQIAFYLEQPPAAIDPDLDLVAIGLDPVYALTLSGDLQHWFGFRLPTLPPWDRPTVNALTDFLARHWPPTGAAAPVVGADAVLPGAPMAPRR
jgi:acyl carrier protein